VVGCTTVSREGVPEERKPVIRDDDDDSDNCDRFFVLLSIPTDKFANSSLKQNMASFSPTRYNEHNILSSGVFISHQY
jgi:hypothetical protein